MLKCMMKPVCVVLGTTGAGKSDLSIELAKCFASEVINSDSMQIYKGLDIITNKVTEEEIQGVPHHLMSFLDFNKEYSVAEFEQDARRVIDDLHARGKIPVIVGGTHYYLQSLLFKDSTLSDIDVIEKAAGKDTTSEKHKDAFILDESPQVMLDYLEKVDPVMAQRWHPQDGRKIRRSLEIFFHTGKRPSDLYASQKKNELALHYKTLVFWPRCDYSVLADRLDNRVDAMLQRGLVNEILQYHELAKSRNFEPDTTRGIWQCIGFKEFIPWLKDRTEKSFASGVDRMKISTRQYAKSQVKWIKNRFLPQAVQIHDRDSSSVLFYVLNSTDLTQWRRQVSDACDIFRDFFNENTASNIVLSEEQKELYEEARGRLKIDPNDLHKRFVCDTCLDKRRAPFVAIGERAWSIHLASRRHRQFVRRKTQREQLSQYKKGSTSVEPSVEGSNSEEN
ncbi:tRNA isopentenyltransferase [Schizosaccharomyces japonicus yFS275]|uniref:tRNA dimethylallyltransferase n=1 Tax=Schizosaccharomyces japonicus (strain yFS275 / FY16936) TaxID=402676 RepID=B6JYB4_SCHJY|nr:tRNA isopentenyltransferase [Schizosaccharomyces japonicus yFS275]EEB06532.2 tRNA isopentenyltransferase [Schizosaccharomyces japonicus yFS275]